MINIWKSFIEILIKIDYNVIRKCWRLFLWFLVKIWVYEDFYYVLNLYIYYIYNYITIYQL